jgi:NAD(P) transhydrogenase subunit alpha
LTEPGKIVVKNGVTIIGLTNLPATVPFHASSMLANNMVKLLALMVDKEGKFAIKREDEVIAGSLVGFEGQIVHPKVREILGMPAIAAAAAT